MIYVITSGEYSDYHICAVATTESRAEELRKMYSNNYSQAEIEEYEENVPSDSWYHPVSIQYWEFLFDEKGNKRYVRQYWDEPNLPLKIYGTSQIRINNIIADDESHAFKIACDKRAEYLATYFGF